MTVEDLRWGVVGAGRMAVGFAEALRAIPGAIIGAVTTRTPVRARAFSDRFPTARIHPSVEALVADPAVDIVYVATPHHRHAPDSLLALRHGKPVLCEKPFGLDASEAREVIALARQQELFCMEAMWMRFIPAVVRACEMVREGAIGEPQLLTADFGYPVTYDPTSRFFDPAQGGGALLDRGVYALSLALMLFGLPRQAVGLTALAGSGVDQHVGMVLRFDHERLAILAASLTSETTNEAIILGSDGRLRIHAPFFCSDRLSVRRNRNSLSREPKTTRDRGLLGSAGQHRLVHQALRVLAPVRALPSRSRRYPIEGNGYGYEAREVMRCVRSGRLESPYMPLDESLRVMELVDIVRSFNP